MILMHLVLFFLLQYAVRLFVHIRFHLTKNCYQNMFGNHQYRWSSALIFKLKVDKPCSRVSTRDTQRGTSSWRPRLRTQHSHVQQRLLGRPPKGSPFLEGTHFQNKSGKQIVSWSGLFPFLKEIQFQYFMMLTPVIYKKLQKESFRKFKNNYLWLLLFCKLQPQNTSVLGH